MHTIESSPSGDADLGGIVGATLIHWTKNGNTIILYLGFDGGTGQSRKVDVLVVGKGTKYQ